MTHNSRIAQYIFDATMKCNEASFNGRVLRIARGVLKRTSDPLVAYPIGMTSLKIPMSHALPTYQKNYPFYSWNVTEIAARVVEKYPHASMIDIGANIGDTVALLRSRLNLPILCIEGEPNYFAILEENAKQWKDVTLENVFVSIDDMKGSWAINTDQGTAHLSQIADTADKGVVTKFEQLTEILDRHPEIKATCHMIKIDTDGFDLGILCSNLDVLANLKPVLFIEYAPQFFNELYDGLAKLKQLQEVGYTRFSVFDNFGRFLLAATFDDWWLLEDLHHYYSLPETYYCDIAFYFEDDADIAYSLREKYLSQSS